MIFVLIQYDFEFSHQVRFFVCDLLMRERGPQCLCMLWEHSLIVVLRVILYYTVNSVNVSSLAMLPIKMLSCPHHHE